MEALEDRAVPAALTWDGPANGNWSVAANWNDAAGNDSTAAPQNNDSLTFNNTADTSSKNDIANLQIASLTITTDYSSTITLDNTLTVTGNVSVSKGTIAAAAGKKLEVPNAASTFTWKGGTISADVELGSATAAPTLTLNGGAITIGGTFTTYATATWTGTDDITLNGGQLNNFGTFDIRVDHKIATAGVEQIQNSGTFKKSQGVGTTEFEGTFTNQTGTVLAGSGVLNFSGVYRQSQESAITTLNGGNITADNFRILAGIVNGIGTITAPLVENSGGSVIPGLGNGAGGVPGTLNIAGDYEQGAAGTFVVNFDAAGNHGVLNVQQAGLGGGHVTLGGTIRVNRPVAYTPPQGTEIAVMTFSGGPEGSFAAADIPNNAWNNGGPRMFDVLDDRVSSVDLFVL